MIDEPPNEGGNGVGSANALLDHDEGSSQPPSTRTLEATLNGPTRLARALIGWLPVAEGVLWLTGRQTGKTADPEFVARCERARAAVANRSEGVDQAGVISDLPATVNGHLDALRKNPISAAVLADGFVPKLVDLSRVCSAQPQIFVEDAAKRVEGLNADDVAKIAAITLPLPGPQLLPSAFDQAKNAWVISSPNPNLRIAGQFNGPVGPGLIGFGFAVAISSSYMQVAKLGDRYFLRDGYHRAYGLIAAGITHVPALVKEFSSFEEVGLPPGLLPQAAYLGSRPPRMADYLNDEVSVTARVPVTQKVVVIQALEVHTLA